MACPYTQTQVINVLLGAQHSLDQFLWLRSIEPKMQNGDALPVWEHTSDLGSAGSCESLSDYRAPRYQLETLTQDQRLIHGTEQKLPQEKKL